MVSTVYRQTVSADGDKREYFNDIATFYNTRLQIIPDRFIASLGRLQPQPLLTATDFERAPVTVKFAA